MGERTREKIIIFFIILVLFYQILSPIVQSDKVHGPNSLSKYALRENETPWIIKSPGECKLTNVGHFKTPPHVWHYWPNTRGQNGGKAQRGKGRKPNNWKELALIPC
jgi:hypothetical protein